jgi:peptidoglycan/LPS O-acetylase OafA/YrhL
MSASHFRPELEGLRGVAVLLVLAAHAGLPLPGGAIGPDLFFALSGYLITGLLLRRLEAGKGVGLAEFYARRFRRILPAIIGAVALTVGAVALLGDPFLLARTAGDGIAALTGVANIHFALNAVDYFAPVAPSPLLPLWSIGVEEQFYLIAPLAIALAFRLGRRVGVGALFALLAIGSTVAAVLVSVSDPVWAYYLLPTRAYGLALGGLVAVLEPSLAPLVRRLPLALVATIALVVLSATTSSRGYPGLIGPLVGLAGALLILGLGERALLARPLRAIASIGPLRFIGRISYSLYLIHFPCYLLPPLAGVPVTPVTIALETLVALALATLLYAFVEQPFRHSRLLGQTPSRVLPRAATVLLVAIVSANGVIAATEISSVTAAPVASERPLPTLAPLPSPSPEATPRVWAPIEIGGSREFLYEGPLPVDLSPALTRARGDADTTLSSGCGLDRRGLVNRICRKGTRGGPRIVIIGDSHAAHWMPALERIGVAYGYEVIPMTKSNCPFYDYLTFDEREMRDYTECAAWRPLVVEAANALDPALVLISSVWYPNVQDSSTTQRESADALGRLVDALEAPVALLSDVAYSGEDIPSCLARHRDEIAPCVIRNPYQSSTWSRAVTRIVAKERNLPWLDLRPALCPKIDLCPPIVDGIIVYHDFHHLTVTMSRHLAGPLGAALAQLMPPPAPPVSSPPHLGPGGR